MHFPIPAPEHALQFESEQATHTTPEEAVAVTERYVATGHVDVAAQVPPAMYRYGGLQLRHIPAPTALHTWQLASVHAAHALPEYTYPPLQRGWHMGTMMNGRVLESLPEVVLKDELPAFA